MKKHKYQKKDLVICYILLGIVIIAYLISNVMGCLAATKDLAQKLNLTDTIELICDCGIVCFYILMILIGYMCVERYIYLKVKKPDGLLDEKEEFRKYICIGGVIILGKFALDKVIAVGGYITYNWNLLKNLHGCVVIKGVIAIAWLVCLVYYLKIKSVLEVENSATKRTLIIFCVILTLVIGVTMAGEDYVTLETRLEWFQVLEEYNKNCDPTVDEYPSRN